MGSTFDITNLEALVVVIATLCGFGVAVYRWFSKHDRAHEKLSSVPDKLTEIEKSVNKLDVKLAHLDGTVQGFMRSQVAAPNLILRDFERQHLAKGNPITPQQAARRQELTDRIQRGDTLSNAELTELMGVLQTELADAQAAAAVAVVLAAIVLIGIVVALLALAGAAMASASSTASATD